MNPDVAKLLGQVFTHPRTGMIYGSIREAGAMPPRDGWSVIAADDCGNLFLLSKDGGVAFWDHETDEVVDLAENWAAFARGCGAPPEVSLDPSQVKSVWIDPEFAKKHGIEVPEDGWKKRKP